MPCAEMSMFCIWVWLKLAELGPKTAGFSLWFHLPGIHFGIPVVLSEPQPLAPVGFEGGVDCTTGFYMTARRFLGELIKRSDEHGMAICWTSLESLLRYFNF